MTICSEGEENKKEKIQQTGPRNSLYPGKVHTPYGVIQWGGKINETDFDETIYLLKAENEHKLNWRFLQENLSLKKNIKQI